MSKIEKLIAKLKLFPTDVSYKDMKKVLDYYKFEKIHVVGSHFKFKKKSGESFILVVHNKRIKKCYIKKFFHHLHKNYDS